MGKWGDFTPIYGLKTLLITGRERQKAKNTGVPRKKTEPAFHYTGWLQGCS